MLIQLHRQNVYDKSKTEFVAQCDPHELGWNPEDDSLQKWIEDVASRHPLAEDERWLMCDESYPKFMRIANPAD